MPANELPDITTSGTNAAYYTVAGDFPTSLTGWGQGTGTLVAGCSGQYISNVLPELELGNNMPKTNRRIVQVFIADPNENIPLEKSLLFQDDKPHLTDLTDQELFFEIDIKGVLEKHNAYRVTVVDKDASEGKSKDVMLEPAKIRDLRMIVVNVAEFK